MKSLRIPVYTPRGTVYECAHECRDCPSHCPECDAPRWHYSDGCKDCWECRIIMEDLNDSKRVRT